MCQFKRLLPQRDGADVMMSVDRLTRFGDHKVVGDYQADAAGTGGLGSGKLGRGWSEYAWLVICVVRLTSDGV